MSEPYFYPDTNMLSVCCDAISTVPVEKDTGLCSKCGEWSEMYIPCNHQFEALDNEAPYGVEICIYCGEKQSKH